MHRSNEKAAATYFAREQARLKRQRVFIARFSVLWETGVMPGQGLGQVIDMGGLRDILQTWTPERQAEEFRSTARLLAERRGRDILRLSSAA